MALAESNTARPYVAKYCKGLGVDVGCGRKKIVPSALGIDFETAYDRPQLSPKDCDAEIICGWEKFFPLLRAGCLDYIFSSALLEDYENSTAVLQVWCRALKPGGYLILYLPIEQLYKKVSGPKWNKHHKADWKSAQDFLDKLAPVFCRQFDVIELSDLIPESKYMFYVVLRKKVRQ